MLFIILKSTQNFSTQQVVTVRKKTVLGDALYALSCHGEGWFLVLFKKRPWMVWCLPGIPLTRASYELYTYRLRNLDHARPVESSLTLLSYRSMRIWLCYRLIIQSDIAPFHIVGGQAPCSSLQSTHA